MGGIWFVFAITVLIAVYSGITFFTNVNNKVKQKSQNEQSAKKNNIYGVVFLVFLIIAIIELFVYIA